MTRRLVVVLGDQLDLGAAAFDGFDPALDAVWMAEVAEESTIVWSSQPRSALFLAAMRHFAQALREAGRRVHYTRLDDDANRGSLGDELVAAIDRLRPSELVMTAPGEHRVLQALRAAAASRGRALEVRPDRHFFGTVREFAAWARSARELRLEFFYREMRRRHRVLMDGDAPCGGRWNFDADNRASFGRGGPAQVPQPPRFAPDATTREVLDLVARRFAGHPGRLDSFAWPVTREQALQALRRFVDERLPDFGRWQDALWRGEPWLWHSQLSAALNLKLLDPHEVVAAAEAAYRDGRVPIESAEGFVRQILGWREYVRGVYWTRMPGYRELNALDARLPLPDFYWSGETPMACLADAIGQTLAHGYAHHIQRLMVTGLYALLLGVEPQAVHRWYLAVYVDAVEWVELPNTLGMSQAADGGIMVQQALRRERPLHREDERRQPLRALPLPPRRAHRRTRLPVHDAVLGLPDAPRGPAAREPADGDAAEAAGPAGPGRTAADRRAGGGGPRRGAGALAGPPQARGPRGRRQPDGACVEAAPAALRGPAAPGSR